MRQPFVPARPRPAHPRHQRPAAQQPHLRAAAAAGRGRHRRAASTCRPCRRRCCRCWAAPTENGNVIPLRTAVRLGLRPAHGLRRERLATALPDDRALKRPRRTPAGDRSPGRVPGRPGHGRAASAAQPQFWRIEGARDFLEGEPEGLSVDSEGRVRLAPAAKQLFSPETPYVWALARDGKGALYAGTGNDGKVFRIRGRDGRALLRRARAGGARAGRWVPTAASTSAPRRTARCRPIDGDGKAEIVLRPADKYIWALAFDKQGRLLVATGSEGRIYRVDKDGKAPGPADQQRDPHHRAGHRRRGARLRGQRARAGSSTASTPTGKVFVLHDSAYREVKALAVGGDGSLYAAVIDGSEKEDREPLHRAAPVAVPVAPGGEVTVTETFTLPPTMALPPQAPAARVRDAGGAAARPRARCCASRRRARSTPLWSSTEETPHSLLATARGRPAGHAATRARSTGSRTTGPGRCWPPSRPSRSRPCRPTRGGAVVLATSNPGQGARRCSRRPARAGTFTSKVQDTDTVSSWGRIRWQAACPRARACSIYSRSGNTGTPDSTWSDWSAAYTQRRGRRRVERARPLPAGQGRAGGHGAAPRPVLDTITTAFLQRNLRPQVQSVTVHPPGEVFQKPLSLTGEVEILGLDAPPVPPRPGPGAAAPRMPQMAATTYSRKLYQKGIQTLLLEGRRPEPGHALLRRPLPAGGRHALPPAAQGAHRRRAGLGHVDRPQRPLRRARDRPRRTHRTPRRWRSPATRRASPSTWTTRRPRSTASLSQPSPARVRAIVRDDSSLVRRTEYAIDGGRWEEVHPVDGINDAQEEVYDFSPPALAAGTARDRGAGHRPAGERVHRARRGALETTT